MTQKIDSVAMSTLGEKHGRAWAAKASAEELQRLEDYYVQCCDNQRTFADVLAMETMAPWGNAEYIAAAIMGYDDENGDRSEAEEFAERLFDEHATDDDYLNAFVCGALNVAS